MALVASPIKRSIIVGAGASVSYDLPLAGGLLKNAVERIRRLDASRARLAGTVLREDPREIAQGDDLDEIIFRSIKAPLSLQEVARLLRETLVQQNLDDFVRDHPSLTEVVSMLITITLFSAMYQKVDGLWHLRPQLRKSSWPTENDWMRQFVGLMRPIVSVEQKLSIISFNYDSLLERSMRMYWAGSELKYPSLDEAVEFVYPHGNFSELPERITSLDQYLKAQASRLQLGEKRDQDARNRAKEIICGPGKFFSVGFSFSDNNLELLGLTSVKSSALYVQTYKNEDVRLLRKLDQLGVPSRQRDDKDMTSLVTNGFFEQ